MINIKLNCGETRNPIGSIFGNKQELQPQVTGRVVDTIYVVIDKSTIVRK